MVDHLDGVLVVPGGLARGTLAYGPGIERIDADEPVAEGPAYRALVEAVRAGEWSLIAPGFVDAHVHGGDGADTMDGPEAVRRLAAFHLRHGTTTLLPTTITSPWPEVLRALEGVRSAAREGPTGGPLPDLPGAHLEGPFISRERLGAQPDATVAPDDARLREILELDVVRVVTMAPEVEGAVDAARALARADVRVSLGHSAAGFDAARAVMDAVRAEGGTVGFTHLFNAMTPLGSREPGLVGAALAEPTAYAELILDLHHVHPASFVAASRAKRGRLLLVTDAMRACGLAEGESELGGRHVRVAGGAARLDDGTLAGSVLTLDRAFAHAVQAGMSVIEASAVTSTVAAHYLGLHDRGQLKVGLRADVVVLDGDSRVRTVVAGGRRVDLER